MNTHPTYGIIGNGRISRHLQHYLTGLNIPFVVWSRNLDASVNDVLRVADIYLVLISDDAIVSFLETHSFLQEKICIHFSGALVTPLAQGFHPLCNFTHDLYDQSFYATIPFVVEEGSLSFNDAFPMLNNPHHIIASALRGKYHALCVVIGNFPTMLWQEARSEFKQMGLPEDLFHVYLQNVVKQYMEDSDNALTGPFARNDQATIEANQNSLQGSRLQKIYAAFRDVFFTRDKN